MSKVLHHSSFTSSTNQMPRRRRPGVFCFPGTDFEYCRAGVAAGASRYGDIPAQATQLSLKVWHPQYCQTRAVQKGICILDDVTACQGAPDVAKYGIGKHFLKKLCSLMFDLCRLSSQINQKGDLIKL